MYVLKWVKMKLTVNDYFYAGLHFWSLKYAMSILMQLNNHIKIHKTNGTVTLNLEFSPLFFKQHIKLSTRWSCENLQPLYYWYMLTEHLCELVATQACL